jgi:protein ImuA|tara:strand:- start:74729 stop:75460 length:732 start_codon:yes stop_codon:yes gene_type:complete
MNLALLKSKGLIGTLNATASSDTTFPYGLGTHGLHEVLEESYGDRAAATGFVLTATKPTRPQALLWISQASTQRDIGRLSEAALQEMTRGNISRLNLSTRHARDALWAAEEAVISGAVSHVIAEVDAADFTATRRLTLASRRHGVPVTLLLPYRSEGATAAATRWRIATRPSSPNSYDVRATGPARWSASLERCRTAPSATGRTFDIEWNDETLSLRVVSGMVAGPIASHAAKAGHHQQRQAG